MKDLLIYLKKNHKTHLIFDFDETIAQLVLAWNAWYTDVARAIAKADPSLRGKSYVDAHNLYVENHGEKALKHIRQLNEKFEEDRLIDLKINSELVDFILDNPQYIYYIWSSNSRKTLEKALSKLGILDRFSKIISRSETKFIKPNPDGFTLIKDQNIANEQYLFIGDSASDKGAAKAIGIDFYKIHYFE